MGIAALLLVGFLIVLPFTPIAGKIKRGLKEVFKPDPAPVAPVEPPADPPELPLPDPESGVVEPVADPPPPVGRLRVPDGVSITELSKDIDLKVTFVPGEGGLDASASKSTQPSE